MYGIICHLLIFSAFSIYLLIRCCIFLEFLVHQKLLDVCSCFGTLELLLDHLFLMRSEETSLILLYCFWSLFETGDNRVFFFPTTAEKCLFEFEWEPLAWARRVSYSALTSTSLRGIMCLITEALSPWLHKTHYFKSGTSGIRRGYNRTSRYQAIIKVRRLHGDFLWNTGEIWIRFWPSLWVFSLRSSEHVELQTGLTVSSETISLGATLFRLILL